MTGAVEISKLTGGSHFMDTLTVHSHLSSQLLLNILVAKVIITDESPCKHRYINNLNANLPSCSYPALIPTLPLPLTLQTLNPVSTILNRNKFNTAPHREKKILSIKPLNLLFNLVKNI